MAQNVQLDTCDNCGRTIGKLEKACVWKDSVVCPECHARLAGAGLSYETPAPARRKFPHFAVSSLLVAVGLIGAIVPIYLSSDSFHPEYWRRLAWVGLGVFIVGIGWFAWARISQADKKQI